MIKEDGAGNQSEGSQKSNILMETKMNNRKGFTLIELMIVVVIVGVLAAVIVPLLLSRVERAKYSEGKAIASQIATATRAYVAEFGLVPASPDLETDLGFKSNELDAKYFHQDNMSVTDASVDTDTGTMNYTIRLTPDENEGLNSGDVVLECINNESNFISPVGM